MQEGFTPLLLAAERGHAEIVQYLRERGADLHAQDEVCYASRKIDCSIHRRTLTDSRLCYQEGGNALMLAALGGHVSVVEYLAEQGLDVSIAAAVLCALLIHPPAFAPDALHRAYEGGGRRSHAVDSVFGRTRR